jgi:hypothetical protein
VSVRAHDAERGGIVVGWLVKIVVSIAIIGFFLFEAGAIIVAHVNADTAATDAASEAAFAVARGASDEEAKAAAVEEARKAGVTVVAFAVATDGRSVTLTIEKRAPTLLVQRIGFMKSWAVVRVTRRQAVVG